MSARSKVAAGILALEDQLAVTADLRRAARHAPDFLDERERVCTLAALERECGEIENALRLLRTHAIAAP